MCARPGGADTAARCAGELLPAEACPGEAPSRSHGGQQACLAAQAALAGEGDPKASSGEALPCNGVGIPSEAARVLTLAPPPEQSESRCFTSEVPGNPGGVHNCGGMSLLGNPRPEEEGSPAGDDTIHRHHSDGGKVGTPCPRLPPMPAATIGVCAVQAPTYC
mmetsp:Transcript_113186/g.283325  ORF Transcript_113186/g.283325 Transcript_113186/m.283325 type:complete len:163 (-) Transcript_113186:24-512(-)